MNERFGTDQHLGASFRRIAEDIAPPDVSDETGHLTRQSLAARHFVDAVGHRVRHDHSAKIWFIWHGHRWVPDRSGGIRRIWLDVLASRYRDAMSMDEGEQRERAIAAIHAAGALDSAIDAGLRIAASSVPVAMTGDEWDRDPWLLGCENGVVDLRTGELRPGRPSDLITRSTNIIFDPAATAPRFERFLLEVFSGDHELIEWSCRLVGASFVGTSKEILALHHGTGNNGKSVCFRTLGLVAGDYGVEIAIETLLGGRRDAGAATSDLMRLRGARLAFTSEPDQAARLNGGALKKLATIDRMTGRELHGRQQEWDPTHTIHLATNHLPDIDDQSEGLWRRIALIPWMVRFAKTAEPGGAPVEDPGLADRLAAEAPGILAWVVRGAVAYAAAGTLHPFPTAVARETEAYRADEDPIRGFVLDRLGPAGDDRAVTTRTLHQAYSAWAEAMSLPRAERLDIKRFGSALAARYTSLGWPVERTLVSGRTAYRGIHIGVTGSDGGPAGVPDGGSGGSDDHFAGHPRGDRGSGNTGKPAERPTRPTTGSRSTDGRWDGHSPTTTDNTQGRHDDA